MCAQHIVMYLSKPKPSIDINVLILWLGFRRPHHSNMFNAFIHRQKVEILSVFFVNIRIYLTPPTDMHKTRLQTRHNISGTAAADNARQLLAIY